MALSKTDRSMTRMQSVAQQCKHLRTRAFLDPHRWVLALSLALVFMLFLGCAASGRQMAKKTPEPEEKLASSNSNVPEKAEKAAVKPGHTRKTEQKKQSRSEKTERKSGRTELEIVRDIAIGLAKKHAPVDQMRLCYAKKTREWWITLFRNEGHVLELKQYIWNKLEDKLDPFCVEKRIAKDALADYLSEQPRGRECSAFEHTKNGWKAKRIRSSRPRPARIAKPQAKAAPLLYAGEGLDVSPRLSIVSGVDRERSSTLTSVSTTPRGGNDLVFVYGSEMKHTDLLKWLRRKGYDPGLVLDASAAKLEGYGFVWNYHSAVKGGGTANIEPREDSVVWGLVLEVDGSLIRALDKKQGSPVTYSRGSRRIPVRRIEDGRTVLAWVYTAKPNRNGRTDIWPTREYKERIIEAASFWGFPQPYVERIREWHTRR